MSAQFVPTHRPSRLHAIARYRETGISVFILILGALVALRAPAFLTMANFRDILLNISILSIVALAQAMVIITHGIGLAIS